MGEVILNDEDEAAVEGRGPNDKSLEERASILQSKYNANYSNSSSNAGGSSLKRDDSTDDLIKSIKEKARKRVEAEAAAAAAAAADDSAGESGRSTPEHLKKYSSETCASESKRLRTFSETLKMLDDDVVADLNVK